MFKYSLDLVEIRATDLRNRGAKLLCDPSPSLYQLGRTLAEMVRFCEDVLGLIATHWATPLPPVKATKQAAK